MCLPAYTRFQTYSESLVIGTTLDLHALQARVMTGGTSAFICEFLHIMMRSNAHLYHSGVCSRSLQLSCPLHRPFNLYTHSSAGVASLSGLAGTVGVSPSQQKAVSREFQQLGLSEKATSSILNRHPAYLKWDVVQDLQPAIQQWQDQLGQHVEQALRP